MSDPITRAIADAKEFVEAAATDGFDPNDALDLLREIAGLTPSIEAEIARLQEQES